MSEPDEPPPVAMVTLRDPVTGKEERVCAESENIIRIFLSVGYVVVEEAE